MRKTLIKEGRVKLGDHVKDKLSDLEGTVPIFDDKTIVVFGLGD